MNNLQSWREFLVSYFIVLYFGWLVDPYPYSNTASCSVGPLISGDGSRIVATFRLNVEDTRVGRVCCRYLAGHLNNDMP